MPSAAPCSRSFNHYATMKPGQIFTQSRVYPHVPNFININCAKLTENCR